MPQKIFLIIICVLALLLLAPYAGCNGGDVHTHTKSDGTAEYSDGLDESLRRGRAADHNSSSSGDETLDRIDDLLAN